MQKNSDDIRIFAGGDIALWIVDGAIHFKVITPHGDPTELTADMAREVAAALSAAADKLD